MKPICVPCQRFYRCKQNGFVFCEQMPEGVGVPPGLAAPDRWRPYKIWRGDLWECPDCGHQTVAGVAYSPSAEHYQPDFPAELALSQLFINDC